MRFFLFHFDNTFIFTQMNQIWEELGPKMKELLELGKTGVVASILAACQRLETYRLEVFIYELFVSASLFYNQFSLNMSDFFCYELQSSQALAAALSSDSESPDSIVARILFLENYLHERSYWKWTHGAKMSILGCLMLQSIFQYPHVC
jgi:nucleolar protein 9